MRVSGTRRTPIPFLHARSHHDGGRFVHETRYSHIEAKDHFAAAIFLTMSLARGRLTVQFGSSTRHCATVSAQPHVQRSVLRVWSACVFCSGVRIDRSIPGILLACAAFSS